ncbi:MAG: sugar ABC transporter permease [Alphaproteobacteria bacterium]|nr:sugar ABC transporter permease [Alphaproteobacteria bacterium]
MPTLVVLFLVAGWPLLRTLWFSFTDTSLSDLKGGQFVGVDNFFYLFEDSTWRQSFKNTVIFAAISVSLETIFGLIIALVLNAHFKGRGWLRTAVLIPWAIPTIISAKMWGWILHDVYGVLNEILIFCHIIKEPLAWTASPKLAMVSVVLVDVWKTTPFMALLLLAGLQLLPQECFEAARVDGIHPLRVFWRVTLPLLKPAITVAVIFRSLDALRIFDLIYVLTSGSVETVSMSVYARQQLFDFQSVGIGSAAATLLFFIISLATLGFLMTGGLKQDK